jgi:hypothetical protein
MKKLQIQIDEKLLKIANNEKLSLAKIMNKAIELYSNCSSKENSNEQKLRELNIFLNSLKK